jgi:hypothetical protein
MYGMHTSTWQLPQGALLTKGHHGSSRTSSSRATTSSRTSSNKSSTVEDTSGRAASRGGSLGLKATTASWRWRMVCQRQQVAAWAERKVAFQPRLPKGAGQGSRQAVAYQLLQRHRARWQQQQRALPGTAHQQQQLWMEVQVGP